MANAFIFHGTAGYPGENWFPWLKKELELKGFDVIVPQFPTPANQTPETWFSVFNEFRYLIDQNTVMIGHSLGGAFLLRLLETLKVPIRMACFISTPVGIRPIKNWESDQPFISQPFNWSAIKKNADHFVVFHSDDDPYVCMGNGKELAKRLDVKLDFISKAGHFNTAAGYNEFPRLLERITETITA